MSRLSFILLSLLVMLAAAPAALAAPAQGELEPIPPIWWMGLVGSVIAFVFKIKAVVWTCAWFVY